MLSSPRLLGLSKSMILCLCNGLSEKDVRTAAALGIACPSEVYRHFGCRPQCAKCVPYVRETLNEARREANGPSLFAAE